LPIFPPFLNYLLPFLFFFHSSFLLHFHLTSLPASLPSSFLLTSIPHSEGNQEADKGKRKEARRYIDREVGKAGKSKK
jgi:hypothetical protein